MLLWRKTGASRRPPGVGLAAGMQHCGAPAVIVSVQHWSTPMRLVTIGLLAAVAGISLQPRPSSAQQFHEYPWCAYFFKDGGSNCYFASYAQCRADISGKGGYCSPNPLFVAQQQRVRPDRRRHYGYEH
jgi:Protein of unknown function (DUF3551)